jgi:hypothetical protein
MAPPDGPRSTHLPTLSWDSVVDDDAPAGAPSAPDPVERPLDTATVAPLDLPTASPADASPSAPLTPPIAFTPMSNPVSNPMSTPDTVAGAVAGPTPSPAPPPPAANDAMVPIQFAPLTLDTSPLLHSVRAPRADDEVTPEPPADLDPEPVASPQPEPVAAPEPVATPEPHAAPEPVVVATVAPVSVVAPDAERPSVELPQIVEATPVVPGAAVDVADPVPSGPTLPRVQAAAPAPPEAPAFETFAPATAPAQRRRKKSRTGLKLVFTLLVLGGVIAAAVVFGRPYLFPGDWDAETGPFAEAVEAARGVEFVEPITLTSEPSPAYGERMVTELVGDWTSDQAMWRALGLLGGVATPASVSQQVVGWQAAVYSTEDGQVYRDEAATGPQADAQIAAAMASASLDQELRWSDGQAARPLDAQVLTFAELRRQAAVVVADSPYAVAVDPIDPTLLAPVPPVVAYELLAPAVYAEFDNPTGSLADIGTGGPGPLSTPAPIVAPDPEPIGTDTLVSSPKPADRSFWYLVLGGFLDPRSAYVASESVVENSVSMAERDGTACVYATFAGGDVAQTSTLRSALEDWSSAAPAEFGSSVDVLSDGTLQLVSCDPGVGFEQPTRAGVARELVGWRTAELATIEAVTAAFGPGADATDAWTIVEASNVGPELAALPADTAPAQTAAAARAAITELFTPADG